MNTNTNTIDKYNKYCENCKKCQECKCSKNCKGCKCCNKCIGCNSIDLYSDKSEGSVVCSDCGLKQYDILDSSPDWNSINSTNPANSSFVSFILYYMHRKFIYLNCALKLL